MNRFDRHLFLLITIRELINYGKTFLRDELILYSFAVVTCYAKIVLQILSVRVKTLSSTNLVASRRVKRKKVSLPVVGVTQKHLSLSSLLLHVY